MDVLTRKERLCGITAILTNNPSRLYPLSHFSELFGAAKSTLSEDVAIIKEAFERLQLGEIEVLMGGQRGIKYIPWMDKQSKDEIVGEIVEKLSNSSRILPGGFIYTADIFLTPRYVDKWRRSSGDFSIKPIRIL